MASQYQDLSEKATLQVYAPYIEDDTDVQEQHSTRSESSGSYDSTFVTHQLEHPASYQCEFEYDTKIDQKDIQPSHSTRIFYVIGAIIRFIIPSFLRRTPEVKQDVKLYPTSYLDGLRGVAALIVCIDHLILDSFPLTRQGWGSAADGSNNWFMLLPMVRIVYAGRSMVAIFFVVSGYALSYKPLKLRNSYDFETFLDNLSSSTFRRPFRLFLPALVGNFISQMSSYMGWFSMDMPGSPGRADGFWTHANSWWRCFREMLDPTNPNPFVGYNKQLWTIPVEFRGSLLIYLTLLGLGKMRARVRLTAEFIMATWFLYSVHWDLFLFISGMILADLRLIIERAKVKKLIKFTPALDYSSGPNFSSILKWKPLNILWLIPFLIGIYLASVASNFEQTPGYVTLASLVPDLYKIIGEAVTFWQSIGAVIIVASVDNAKFLQNIFTTSFAQYLGRISFSIYIVHVPVLFSMRDPILKFFWTLTGQSTTTSYTIGFALASIILVPLVFWLSDIFWRCIDEPSVKAAKWLADRFTLDERQ